MSHKPISLAALLAFAGACHGQSLAWTLVKPVAPGPSARYDATIAYDPVGRQLFTFGGQDSGGTRNDLWSFSFDKRTWTLMKPAGGPPLPRFGHTLVFDSARRRLILFGGQSGTFYSDVWAYDIAANTWNQLGRDDTGPARRYGHGGIYDAARDRLVISHGFTTSGRFDDTWAFDLKGNKWINLTPAGALPLKRCLFHSAYDGARGQMYLYGGCASGFGPCPLGDLWSFDLVTNQWTERTPAANMPPARVHYGMAFDDARSRLVVFGGSGNALLSDTWDFNPAAGNWQAADLAGASPSARERQEATYAPGIGMVMFGGSTVQTYFDELWVLAPRALTVGNAFSGAGGGVAPGELVSIYGAALGPDAGVATSFDAATGKLPTSVGGASATFNGVPAPVYYAGSGQWNVQVPYELAGSAQAVVSLAGLTTTLPVVATHPGAFPTVFNGDGTVNAPSNPAGRGSTIFFFATGQGVTSPASVTGKAAVGSFPEPVAAVALSNAVVTFQGQAPYTAGVMQVNAKLAADAPVGSAVQLRFTVGGVAAQEVTVAIR